MASGAAVAKRRRSPAAFGYAHPWLRAVGLLLPAVGAFSFFYLAALAVLFVSAFWTVDAFTGQLVHHWTTSNFSTLWHQSTYRTVALRTISIAAAVTITDAIIAFPFAYFMARIAGPKLRAALFILVFLPLALPGVVAGSIFTFSLTLGDYITPVLIGGTSSQFIGNVVYDSVNQ